MHGQVVSKLLSRFHSYTDLAEKLDDELLSLKVDVPKHKSLAEHLWCLVGARESYAKSIEQGSWAGFNCSMETFSSDDFRKKLRDSNLSVEEVILNVSDWSDERTELLLTLSEHEVMHEGQIIRHMYALERELPKSWVWA